MKAWKLDIKRTGHYLCAYGGWNCNCCSPSPKARPKARRSVRRLLKQQDKNIDTSE